MYKNLLIIFTITMALLILSCSKKPNYTVKEIDGVKYYFNKSEPSTVLNINPVELFEIIMIIFIS
jgi:ABC-type oligopeptide transport system substrate-binding subunit